MNNIEGIIQGKEPYNYDSSVYYCPLTNDILLLSKLEVIELSDIAINTFVFEIRGKNRAFFKIDNFIYIGESFIQKDDKNDSKYLKKEDVSF